MGNSITCVINYDYRIAATLYPRNMVCFGYIIVNTLYEGDNKWQWWYIIVILLLPLLLL